MQYKIEGLPEQLGILEPYFTDYPYQIKNQQLHILTDLDETITFFSMVRDIIGLPVSVDYMTRETIKFVIL